MGGGCSSSARLGDMIVAFDDGNCAQAAVQQLQEGGAAEILSFWRIFKRPDPLECIESTSFEPLGLSTP